jgi:hypothetical protein
MAQHFRDLKRGVHYNEYLQRSYIKYGHENFKWELIESVTFLDDKKALKQELLEREQFWIDNLIIRDGKNIGYNISLTAGSCLGIKFSEERKKRISESMIGSKNHMYGKVVSEETRKKLSESSKNMTEETKKRISEKGKGNKHRSGKKHSEETKKKMSISNKGKHSNRIFSEETRHRISEAGKGRFVSEETRQKKRESMLGKNTGRYIIIDGKKTLMKNNTEYKADGFMGFLTFIDFINKLNDLDDALLDRHPILKYRINNFRNGISVRGLTESDAHKCAIVLDDSVIAGDYHFPCVIYMREQGEAVGKVGLNMRQERKQWFDTHDTHLDPICSRNCLDVCRNHNSKYRDTH